MIPLWCSAWMKCRFWFLFIYYSTGRVLLISFKWSYLFIRLSALFYVVVSSQERFFKYIFSNVWWFLKGILFAFVASLFLLCFHISMSSLPPFMQLDIIVAELLPISIVCPGFSGLWYALIYICMSFWFKTPPSPVSPHSHFLSLNKKNYSKLSSLIL